MTLASVRPTGSSAPRVPAPSVPTPLLRGACDLEVVIPAYNEERRLPATLVEIVRELCRLEHLVSRIVIVDNGSSDRTAEVVDRIAVPAGGPELVVVGCSTPGKGAAVKRGIVTSQARMVGFVDADLSVPPAAIADAVARLEAGHEVVIASRRCAGARYEVRQPRVRRIGGWTFRRTIRSLVPGITDSQCGFKFFTLGAARQVFADIDVAGFAFDVELLMRAARHGYAVSEQPVAWSDDRESTFGLVSHAPEIVRDIMRLHRIDGELARRTRFVPVADRQAGPATGLRAA